MPLPYIVHFSPDGAPAPAPVYEFARSHHYNMVELERAEDVLARVSRAYPAAIALDAAGDSDHAFTLCRSIKAEPFTAVVPVIIYVATGSSDAAAEALEAGADEVLTAGISQRESELRLELALRRAERDVSVHPTTRLPGTVQIERDFAERLRTGEKFAVCYADLDHFKEFNDRYGYNRGDRVILILSRILRDIVRGYSQKGFIGHIGGDDFIFTVPLDAMNKVCGEIVEVFEELIPLQYTVEDRAHGGFTGKDRRGNVFEVPLMTLSIGVVTNQIREFRHTAEISESASEMKSYAKTLPGSLYAVDRRTGKAFTTTPV